ncbi:MAG: hypothetical protein ACLFN8_01010 [Candidatus Woesearchaeota archaeon]
MLKYRQSGRFRFFILLLVFVIISLSVGALAFRPLFFDDLNMSDDKIRFINEFESSKNNRAVILTASSGALGFGHTTLLLEHNNSWYYFSWQLKKVVFVEVPSFAMSGLDAFNLWLAESGSFQNYHAPFDSALLVRGNFSSSFVKAESFFLDYLDNQNMSFEEFSNFDLSLLEKNREYNMLFNNCVEISYDILLEGGVNQSVFNSDFEPSFISNIAKMQFENDFNLEEFLWD